MAERPLPEAIRGCWFYVSDDVDISEGVGKSGQILMFRVNGSFTRYQIKDQELREAEKGDYTFDGNFLIIRGRNTDTFRVYLDSYWRWTLEGKKTDYLLLRGLYDEDSIDALPAEAQRDIRILPLRVGVHATYQGAEPIYDLVYQPADGESQRVGSFFAEHEAEGRVFVGVTPLVEGIESRTWERIIRDSYLDLYLSKPEDVGVVTVRILDTNEARVFNYQIG